MLGSSPPTGAEHKTRGSRRRTGWCHYLVITTPERRGSSRGTEQGSRDWLSSLFLRVRFQNWTYLHLPNSSKRLCRLGWLQTAPFPGLRAGLLSSVTSGCCLHSGPIALQLLCSPERWLPAPELSRDCPIDLAAQLHHPHPLVQIFSVPQR